jgi:hypothetical protein
MKWLPDGATVLVSRRPVSGVWLNYMYIEEADRSSGIKVFFNRQPHSPDLRRGNLVTFHGRIETVNNECVIYAEEAIECDDLEENGQIGPVGMSLPSIMGWPLPPRTPTGPRVTGLVPLGLAVRVWGRVTATRLSDEDYFFYLDDGWGLKDRSGLNIRGIRVYSSYQPEIGQFVVATGVLTNKIISDPTPGVPGDEVCVPAVEACFDQDPCPIENAVMADTQQPAASVTGRIRLVGQGPPGVAARLYCQNGVTVVDNVTDTFVPFTLTGVSTTGCPVAASAPGYISNTRIAAGGETGVDFELMPAELFVELAADTSSVQVCASSYANITAMLRDNEGKPFSGHTLKLTTTRGLFVESGTTQLISPTDAQGQVRARLTAGSDGPGVARIVASTYPSATLIKSLDLRFVGPCITVSANPTHLTEPGMATVSAQLAGQAGPIAGSVLSFKTDHGTFQESGTATCQLITDAQGSATAHVWIGSPGTAAVVVQYADACSHRVSRWAAVSYDTQPWFAGKILGSCPLTVDLDGTDQGRKEVVLLTSDGDLVALSSSGSLVWSRALSEPGNNSAACVTLDAGPSARPCIFLPSESQLARRMYGFASDGSPLAGWPAGSNYPFLTVAPSIGDINNDGSPEIVCGDESCYVFSWNPTGNWKKNGSWNSSFLWHNITAGPSITIKNSTCALGNLDNDPAGSLDVLMGSNYEDPLFAFPGDLWGDFASTPAYIPGYPRNAPKQMASSPAIGDIDGDGLNDLAIGCSDSKLYMWLSHDDSWTGYDAEGPIESSPALYDVDSDGKLDVIVGSDAGKIYVFNWRGEAPEGWAGGVTLSTSGSAVKSSPVLGDVNGDGRPEIVVGCNDGCVYALYIDGTDHTVNGVPTGALAWVRSCVPPGQSSAIIQGSPAIDDIDADGKVEVVVGSSQGVYVFHFDAPYNDSLAQFPWPTFHRDNQRTGCTTAPPAPTLASIQGYVRKNGVCVLNAKVYIAMNDGSPVYVPGSDPQVPRDYILTVGTGDPEEARRGAYCINQLPANTTYKLTVVAPNEPEKVISGVAVTTGLLRLDIDL